MTNREWLEELIPFADSWVHDQLAYVLDKQDAELAEVRRGMEAARADYRCALQYIDRLRNERDAAIDAARGEP